MDRDNPVNRQEQEGFVCCNDVPYATMTFVEQNRRLWEAGCECLQPLNGWRPFTGPRCRLCGVEANAWDAYEDHQARIL